MTDFSGLKLSRKMSSASATIILALVSSASPASAEPEPVRIGALLSVTGPLAFVGDPQEKTLRMLEDLTNKEGGIKGRRIQIVVYDTAADARQATTLARRLIDADKVDLIIGPSTTGETMAIAPIVAETRTPLISMGAGNVIVEPTKSWVFKTPQSYRQAVRNIFADMQGRRITSVGIIAGSGGADQDCRNEARKAAGDFDVKIVADETHGPSDTDMTPQLTKIRGKAPAAVLGCNGGATAVITTRNYRQLGLKMPLYFQHGAATPQFVEQTSGGAEGVRVPVPAVLLLSQLEAGDPQRDAVMAYEKNLAAYYRESPSGFGGYAYDAMKIALDAIGRAGTTEKSAVREQIEKTKEYVGVTGIYSMSGGDHMGLDERSFRMTEITGGQFKIIKR